MWQDAVFTIGGLIFAMSLIPMLTTTKDNLPPLSTSILTGLTLVIRPSRKTPGFIRGGYKRTLYHIIDIYY
jgi:hypothetical protein